MSLPTLSVIIPAYNEEGYIRQCLDALLRDISEIHEIIVVDNGSSDKTCEIVKSASATNRKIKILSEPARGVAFARNAGFRAASGEILGRIDADTRVRPGWATAIRVYFGTEVSNVGAVTGLNNSYDSPFQGLKGWWVSRQVRTGAYGGGRRVGNLHGTNMAIRASAWLEVEGAVSTSRRIHEDVDLALCLLSKGVALAQLTDMMVDLSPRRALTPPRKFTEYVRSGFATFELHDELTSNIRRALQLHWAAHALVFALYRPFDPNNMRYSLRYLFTPLTARELPVEGS